MKNLTKWAFLAFLSSILASFSIPYSFASEGSARFIEALSGDKLMGKLKSPVSLFVSKGNKRLYIADTGNNRLVSYDSELKFRGDFDAGGKLKHPICLVKNSNDQFIVIEGDTNALVFIDISKKIYKPFEISGVPKKPNPIIPGRLAIDDNDNLYITDRGNGVILVLNQEGRYIREITYKNKPVDFSDIRVDNKGFVYSLSTLEGKVYIFNNEGEEVSVFGARGNRKNEFLFPTSIAVGSDGLVYVLDQHKGTVLVYNVDGKFQFSFSKKGQSVGNLFYPSYIYADQQGKIYIADRGNDRVQIFQRD